VTSIEWQYLNRTAKCQSSTQDQQIQNRATGGHKAVQAYDSEWLKQQQLPDMAFVGMV